MTLWEAWDGHAESWIAFARHPDRDGFWWGTWPELAALLPSAPGLVVDVGCGEGRAARELQRLGHRVVGVDHSWALALAAAQQPQPVAVVHGDAARLPLRDGCAGTALACMSLLDMDDLTASVNEIGRIVRPGGHLCVALVHPFLSAFDFDAYRAGHLTVTEPYLMDRRYVDQAKREGVTMTFASMHRPLSRYLDAFFAAGFVMDRFREFGEEHVFPWLLTARLVRRGLVGEP